MFFAILGHDLKAPLVGLDMAGLSLADDLPPKDIEEIRKRITRNVELMKNMAGDLVEFNKTKLGSGIPVNRNEADIKDIANTALANAEAVQPNYKLNLHSKGDLIGSFDSTQLHQLFTNLLINTGQYGTKDSPTIMKLLGESDDVLVQLFNQGSVIHQDALKSSFKPLVQLATGHGTESRPRSSMGLGLFIVEEIAIAHGGLVGVTSDAANGTTFTARLPRYAANL